MRLNFLLAVLLCLFSNMAWAQLRVGAEVGMVKDYPKDNAAKISTDLGFRTGIVGNYTFFEKLRVETGLSYAQKGVLIKNLPSEAFKDFNSFDAKVKYLEIPLSVGVVANVCKHVNLIPKVGAYTNIGLKNSWAYGYKDGTRLEDKLEVFPPQRTGIITNNYFEQYDFGVLIGMDLEILERIAFRASYNIGMNTMYGMFLDSPDNRSLNISLCYYFLKR